MRCSAQALVTGRKAKPGSPGFRRSQSSANEPSGVLQVGEWAGGVSRRAQLGDSMGQWVGQSGALRERGTASTSLQVAAAWLEKALGALSHTLSHHWGFRGHVPPTECVCVCVSDPLSFPGLCPFPPANTEVPSTLRPVGISEYVSTRC